MNKSLIFYHILITLNGLFLGVMAMERNFVMMLGSLAVFLILLVYDSRLLNKQFAFSSLNEDNKK